MVCGEAISSFVIGDCFVAEFTLSEAEGLLAMTTAG